MVYHTLQPLIEDYCYRPHLLRAINDASRGSALSPIYLSKARVRSASCLIPRGYPDCQYTNRDVHTSVKTHLIATSFIALTDPEKRKMKTKSTAYPHSPPPWFLATAVEMLNSARTPLSSSRIPFTAVPLSGRVQHHHNQRGRSHRHSDEL